MSELTKQLSIDFEKGIDLKKDEIQNLIGALESEMKDMSQIETPLKHYFSKDLYAREMTIPKGAIVVGKIHKFQSLSIISKGDISILSVDGVMRVQAPYTIVASPGAKRLVYAHEETVWTVCHATKETDLEQIENEVIAKTYDEVAKIEAAEPQKELEAVCLGEP